QIVARVDDLEVVEGEDDAEGDDHQPEDHLHGRAAPPRGRGGKRLHRAPRTTIMIPDRMMNSGHELLKLSPNRCICDTIIHTPIPISQKPPAGLPRRRKRMRGWPSSPRPLRPQTRPPLT